MSEPAPSDAWGRAIRRGAKQEGIKTEEQRAEDEAEEAKLMEERLKLRWSAHGGIGLFASNGAQFPPGRPELTLGAGLRKGISRLWDFQARASLSIVPATSTLLIPNADATFRAHFGEASPWFFGTGARLGGVVGGGGNAGPLFQALLEIGVVVADHIEIAARPTFGIITHNFSAALGFTVAGGYVF
ncbi:MAG: hypothetical protein IPF92_17235 [Myxococcales bacterium]|nr:hypothetical protein [Myxococcales bacterium]